jgi:hypothetical protein
MKIKKKTVSDLTYKITKIYKARNSQVNQGGINWRIEFECQEDKTRYYTQIDSSMENFNQWKEIMDLGEGTVLGNLRIKDAKTKLINADSEPTVKRVSGNTFHDLFQ